MGLSRHYKADWPFVEVKTGSELATGRYNLAFLETPMLHWPDSMMTYLKEEADPLLQRRLRGPPGLQRAFRRRAARLPRATMPGS